VTDGAPLQGETRTIRDVLAEVEAHGFTGQFAARPGAKVECFHCHHVMEARDIDLDALNRLEGASDPDDMLAVLSLTCTKCGTKGTVVVNYGPESTPEDADVLVAVEDRRPPDRPEWAS
jgi:hypothetical protein